MSIRYRVLCLLMVLGLAGSPWATRAQNAPVPSSQEENLKGQIWTITARRIWADVKPKQPKAPQPWATGTDFANWALAQKQDKSELGILRGAVIERIGKGQTGSASQVAQAIVDEIAQRREKQVGALARVNVVALHTELTPFIQLATPADTATAALDSMAPAGEVQPQAPTEAAYQDTVPENVAQLEPTGAPTQVAPTYWGMSAAVAGTLLALLGAVLGAGLYRALRRPASSSQLAPDFIEPAAFVSPNSSVMESKEYKDLRQAYTKLQSRVRQLEQELAELKSQLAGAPVVAAPVAVSTVAETDDLLAVQLPAEVTYEQPTAQLPPATRYGPVQETPFVEERKIVDNPLPQLALMLTVNPHYPDQASFTLNPHVNQSMLIGDGLNRLQKFFDYDPPVGRINSVAAAAAGTLQRQADGWQVVERARLVIR